jgi:hypothetical protein
VTILQIRSSYAPARTLITERPSTSADHLLCTGSLILLPDVCVG